VLLLAEQRTYNAITRSQIEYGCSIWGPAISKTNMSKLQKIQNTALRITTGCYKGSNTQHLHDETETLPTNQHIQLHSSLYRQRAQHPSHPSYKFTTLPPSDRLLKQTTFNNKNFTTCIPTDITVEHSTISTNCSTIHSSIVQTYLSSRKVNSTLTQLPPSISKTELSLPRNTRCLLAQLRSGKSNFLLSYRHLIRPTDYPSPTCPVCLIANHDTNHLFNCPSIPNPNNLTCLSLWSNPVEVAELLARWQIALPHLN